MYDKPDKTHGMKKVLDGKKPHDVNASFSKELLCVPLAEKHEGMRISASGILNRVGGNLKFGAQQMHEHLQQVATRYYAGDIKAVDEFLQLYCLDDDRPNT